MRRELGVPLVFVMLLGGCATTSTTSAQTSTVTVTGAAVTVTADPVTVTPPTVTRAGATVTRTAAEVTVTADPEENRGGALSLKGGDAATSGPALDALEALPVKGRAPKTGYSRDLFGPAWSDAVEVDGGRNGCDTRNDVLRRDLDDLVVKDGTYGCVALTGTLADPYSGETLPFERGTDAGSSIEIDHMVALSNAWQTGAQQLDAATRQDLANDPLNLVAVSGWTNRQKSDGDAATWLPPHKAYRCELVARQIAVKAKYGLWVTPPESEAMQRVLSSCPGHELPTQGSTRVPPTS